LIDLHCHLLPGIDDGAPDLATSLEMARIAVADGITTIACTPHIYPGLYENNGPDILRRVEALQAELDAAGIALTLVAGCDAHLTPTMVAELDSGHIPTLAGSRYFLFEPPHHVAPPRLEQSVLATLDAGYMPIITHPERLSWIESHYDTMKALARAGAWMQLTAGSITGRFGKRAQHWSERMLDEGLVHLVSTDAHNLRNRKPLLSEAVAAVGARLGDAAAHDMVVTRPRMVLANAVPATGPRTVGGAQKASGGIGGLRRWFRAA
jgi:protein-tyrosine phosphatase